MVAVTEYIDTLNEIKSRGREDPHNAVSGNLAGACRRPEKKPLTPECFTEIEIVPLQTRQKRYATAA